MQRHITLGLLMLLAQTVATGAPLSIADVLQAPTLAPYSPPSFSPDNQLLAYVVTDNARRQRSVDDKQIMQAGLAWYAIAADIWITELGSGEARNLTNGGHNWAPAWSPDGRQLAFLADRSGSESVGPARLWVWERSSGKLRQASEADVRDPLTAMQWTADGHSLLVTTFVEHRSETASPAAQDEAAAGPQAASAGVTARVFEFDPTVPNAVPSADQVDLDLWLRDIAVIDTRDGAVRRLTRGLRIGHYAMSPDARHIVYSVLTRAQAPGSGQYLYRVVLQDLVTADQRVLAQDVPFTLIGMPFSWSPGSESVAWRTGGPLADDEIHVASRRAGRVRQISRQPRSTDLRSTIELDPPLWDPPGKKVLFIREGVIWCAAVDGASSTAFASSTGHKLEFIAPREQRLFAADLPDAMVTLSFDTRTKQSGFARVDLRSGAVTQILEEAKRYGGYGTEPTISADRKRIAFVAESALDPADLYSLASDLAPPRKITQIAPRLSERELGRAEAIEWHTLDGEVQRGALVLPAGYERGKRYPLIVKVYGGSAISDDLNRFGYASAAVENLQLFATRGYALLVADSKLNAGTPMVDLMKSVMPGIDKVVEMGVADPARLGITGHSYGGYSALSLIVQSPRFKAAVMRAGFGNLLASYGHLEPSGANYGLAWAESGQGRMGGNPWEFRERYLENSPILYLDRVATPLLIVHGDQDDAVPAFLADEIFTGLRRLGKPVSYARYAGENHWEGTWSYANQVDALDRQIAWFERYLKPAASKP
jgi:dipeptidyl aminopeptidase/acylaminoacyl peptidase